MCGICGIIHKDTNHPVSSQTLKRMCDVLKHRGPDEDGFYLNRHIGIGMRRLKVIDLSTGSQPIFNEDKSIIVVLNGEIYNYLELRKHLLKKGHRFYSHSDTEVIVHLYEDYQEHFLDFLNGMFAIALWDDKQKTLILARDRMGEKPLHYLVTDDGISFSSELKSFLTDRQLKRELNTEAIYHYFSFNSIPAPHTIFRNIKKLYPAHYLKYQFGNIKLVKYWDFTYEPQYDKSEEYFCETIREALTRSLKQRIRSDVPFGAFLSGGIDSSIVVALLSSILEKPIKTFSIGFEEDKYNELKYARQIAEKFKTDHYEFVTRPSAINLLEKLVWHFDEPFGGPSAIPTYLVSELARKHVTVVLTGDGGDELFTGYKRHVDIKKRKWLSAVPLGIRNFIAHGIGDKLFHSAYGKRYLQTLALDSIYYYTISLSEVMKRALFTGDFLKSIEVPDSFEVVKKYVLPDSTEYLNRFCYLDINLFLSDNYLVKVDRMTMANSLESRCLFLDHEIVELAAKIPVDLKLKGSTTKYILKKSMQNVIPKSILNRGKQGFALPVDIWMRNELKDLITHEVEKCRENSIFNYDYISRILKEHLQGRRNHQMLLWLFLIFQLWYEKFYLNPNEKFASSF